MAITAAGPWVLTAEDGGHSGFERLRAERAAEPAPVPQPQPASTAAGLSTGAGLSVGSRSGS